MRLLKLKKKNPFQSSHKNLQRRHLQAARSGLSGVEGPLRRAFTERNPKRLWSTCRVGVGSIQPTVPENGRPREPGCRPQEQSHSVTPSCILWTHPNVSLLLSALIICVLRLHRLSFPQRVMKPRKGRTGRTFMEF